MKLIKFAFNINDLVLKFLFNIMLYINLKLFIYFF